MNACVLVHSIPQPRETRTVAILELRLGPSEKRIRFTAARDVTVLSSTSR